MAQFPKWLSRPWLPDNIEFLINYEKLFKLMTAKETLDKVAKENDFANFLQLFWEGTYDMVETVVLKAMDEHANSSNN